MLVSQTGNLIEQLPDAFDEALIAYDDWYQKQNERVRDVLPEANVDDIRASLGIDDLEGDELFSVQDLTNFALPVLQNASNVAVGVVANILIILLVSIFLLIDPMDYARGVILLFPLGYQKRAVEIMVELRMTVTAWMTAQVLSILITVFLIWLILGVVLGVPNALALGAIAGLMTFIPNIGSIVALVPIIIFTLADNPSNLPFVLVAYVGIQQAESSFITPMIVKSQLNIPAGALLIFQVISGSLFGFLGIVLAVPLLATIITLVRELYVEDALGMRDTHVDLQEVGGDRLKLIHVTGEGEAAVVSTSTFNVRSRTWSQEEEI